MVMNSFGTVFEAKNQMNVAAEMAASTVPGTNLRREMNQSAPMISRMATNSRRAWMARSERSWSASAYPNSPAPIVTPPGRQLPKMSAARAMNPRPAVWPSR